MVPPRPAPRRSPGAARRRRRCRVLGLFVADDALLGPAGSPRRAFLSGCLAALDESMDGRLLVVHGRPETVLPRVSRAVGADGGARLRGLHAVRQAAGRRGREGAGRRRCRTASRPDRRTRWRPAGCARATEPGTPSSPRTTAAGPRTAGASPPESAKRVRWIDLVDVDGTGRQLRIDRARRVACPTGCSCPTPARRPRSTAGGNFLDERRRRTTTTNRNRPDRAGTSRMSPYLKWGCIHPRTMLADLADRAQSRAPPPTGGSWPGESSTPTWSSTGRSRCGARSIPAVDRMTWASGADADEKLAAWQAGRTGFPVHRRGDAPAARRGLDAQPGADGRRIIPDQGPAPAVAGRRPALPATPGGRRRRRRTTTAGSGSPGRGRRRRRSTASSTRSARARSSIPTAITCARTCPSCAASAGKAVHRPWDLAGGIPEGLPRADRRPPGRARGGPARVGGPRARLTGTVRISWRAGGRTRAGGRARVPLWPPVALGVPLVIGVVITAAAGDPLPAPGRALDRLGAGRRLRRLERLGAAADGAAPHRPAARRGHAVDRGERPVSRQPQPAVRRPGRARPRARTDVAVLLGPAAAPVGVAGLVWGAILPEERYLRATFGAAYADYAAGCRAGSADRRRRADVSREPACSGRMPHDADHCSPGRA